MNLTATGVPLEEKNIFDSIEGVEMRGVQVRVVVVGGGGRERETMERVMAEDVKARLWRGEGKIKQKTAEG